MVETLPERLPKSTGTCLHTATISSWKALDSRRILVEAGQRDWIVEFYTSCHGVRSSEQLAFSSNDSRLCDYRSDAFLVRGERCPVASIRPYVERFDRELQEELDQLEGEGRGQGQPE